MVNFKGKLYVVATPIGNLEDISQRAIRILQQVDCIGAEDTRHSRKLLQFYNIATELLPLHEHNEKNQAFELIKKLQKGQNVALISDAGTPLISDPGLHLVKLAQSEQIQVVPIPGPCAAVTALSALGFPTDSFYFAGFLPAKSGARIAKLRGLTNFQSTMVFYEAPHRIEKSIADMSAVFGQERLAAIGRELTKQFESFYSSDLGKLSLDIKNKIIPIKGEFVIIIGGQRAKIEDTNQSHKLLEILLQEMPLKQAVNIVCKFTSQSKNELYKQALELKL